MSRSVDLDRVAPDEVGEVKKEEIVKEKETRNEKLETGIEKTEKIKEEIKTERDTAKVEDKIYEIAGHTKHALAALLVNPEVFSFEEKDEKEKILLVARPHWFTNVGWGLITVLLLLAPSLLAFVPLIGGIPAKFQMLGIVMWYLVSFAYAFEKFLSWYFDVMIITDERVIDIDFNNLLNKKFSEAKISMIQDITSRVTGVSQTLFNYGTVYIQTAAEVPEITFENVPHPERIIKVLQMLREEEEREAIEGRTR